ncbi:MAG TPA: glycosyltransferase family 2 protein [Bacteriovoracaceae bacterium]|nr:glycosyltransferase family 2 protein [Bacteriovoracaceae bacterium]
MYPDRIVDKDLLPALGCAGHTPIAVIILTYNEEANIDQALNSVVNWAREVFVLDSFSADNSVEIASQAGCTVVQNAFVDYAKQRNFAIDQLPIESEWILFLDADEWLTEELKAEISRLSETRPEENGFYIKRRMIWMGKWMRRGYYPTWILRMFRRGKGRCEDRAVNEHLIVEGKMGYLQHDFIHEDRKGIDDWIVKHNRYATREALELIKQENQQQQDEIKVHFWGTQAERKRWLRYRVWNRMPPLVRPFFYFIYRYLLTGAFCEGRAAFVFHFLHALWYPLLIDAKYLELRIRK